MAEYFDHGDTQEAYLSLDEAGLGRGSRAHLVVVAAVELAMEHKPSHREMTSVLLADLYGHLLFETHYAKGTTSHRHLFPPTTSVTSWMYTI